MLQGSFLGIFRDMPEEKVVQIKPPAPHETRLVIITLVIFIFIIGILSAVGGFFIGKISSSGNTKISQGSSPTIPSGWSTYKDDTTKFSIAYPKEGKTDMHNQSDYEGVKISFDKGYVNLWLLVDQPLLLGEKHQKALEKEEDISVNIADKKAEGASYKYKAGNYFVVLVAPDGPTTPQVTFWVEADDEKVKDEALKIVESFRFTD